MRTFIAALLVAALMLTGIGIYIGYLTKTTEELSNLVTEISEQAKQEKWEACKERIKTLTQQWEHHEKILCAFTDHGDLDEIRRTISEVDENARFEDSQNTAMYASVLLILIERLTENEYPTWENILKTYTRRKMQA